MNIMVSKVNYESLMEYFKTLQDLWTQAIHTVYIFVDNRSLADVQLCPDFWKNFCPWMKARASTIGPLRKCTTAIHVPICKDTGLDRVHFTWAGTFGLESLVYLFPDIFFLRLPNGQYGPVSQLSRSEKCCTGPFNWGEAHCAGEKVKR